MDKGKCPLDAQQPEGVEPQAIADQGAQLHSDQQGQQRSLGSNASVKDARTSQPNAWVAPRTNPYQPKAGAQAITNPYSLDDQRKIGNAMATAAPAIREAARALAEGRGYEPEPPLFELDTHRAKASPGTLLIAKSTSPARQASHQGDHVVQLGTEITTSSSRRPGDWATLRSETVASNVYPTVP